MKNVVVIGVGALGKRHLQSLTTLKDDVKLYAVENNVETLKALEEEFNVKENNGVSFMQNIEDLPKDIEAAVFATSSNVRKMLFEKLIAHATVKNIVFEKVLFQRVEDYYFVEQELKKNGIKAWVNCARREWDSYHWFKEKLQNCNYFTFTAIGGQWGMGCNGIHMLDLIEFLADGTQCNINLSKLLPKVVESKRKGFYEVFGSITGDCDKCQAFQITCLEDTDLPFMIEVVSNNLRAIINESKQEIYISEKQNKWEWKKEAFPMMYQSQLTGKVVSSILETGNCRLASFDESMKLHLEFIEPLLQFFATQGMEEGLCPIT